MAKKDINNAPISDDIQSVIDELKRLTRKSRKTLRDIQRARQSRAFAKVARGKGRRRK